MHFTSTSEDFASTTFESSLLLSSSSPQNDAKLKILLLSSATSSKSQSSPSSCFDINTAHLFGSVGYLILKKQNDELQETKSEFWFKSIVECASRFEKITGKKSLVEKSDTMSRLNGIEIIDDVDANSSSSSSVTSVDFLMEQAMMSSGNNVCVTLIVDFAHCEKPSKIESSSIFSTITSSHGIPLGEINEESFVFVPFCVVQPNMHRRIPLSCLSGGVLKEQHAVTGTQLAMEVAQKAGLLGKYGA